MDINEFEINDSILEQLGFKPCEPWENWDANKYPYAKDIKSREAFNDDGLYKWFGYKESKDGAKWYVVWHNLIGAYYFQRQVKIRTIGDLINVYQNSAKEDFKNN